MESGGFSHGAAFHPAFLPKLPSYKQTPWTAPPAHYSSLTRRGVALCCVAMGFPPRLTFSTHIWKVSREHLWGVKFFSRWYVRLLQRKKKKKKSWGCEWLSVSASRLPSASVGHLFRPTLALPFIWTRLSVQTLSALHLPLQTWRDSSKDSHLSINHAALKGNIPLPIHPKPQSRWHSLVFPRQASICFM